MPLSIEKRVYLEQLCQKFRKELLELLYHAQTGHPGGSLSCTEILTTLYFSIMNVDPNNPQKMDRDRFILSKGHAAPMLYLILAEKGFFPKDELSTFRQCGSRLQGHPCAHKLPGIDLSTGPLGLGLSAGVGMALASELSGVPYHTFVLLGDGEIQEGAVWEAAMTAAKYKPKRLTAIIDRNKVQLDGTIDEIMPEENLAERFEAFGWNVLQADGHNISQIFDAISQAKLQEYPTVILADTVKGKGISFMEGKNEWHGKAISAEDYSQARQELEVNCI